MSTKKIKARVVAIGLQDEYHTHQMHLEGSIVWFEKIIEKATDFIGYGTTYVLKNRLGTYTGVVFSEKLNKSLPITEIKLEIIKRK